MRDDARRALDGVIGNGGGGDGQAAADQQCFVPGMTIPEIMKNRIMPKIKAVTDSLLRFSWRYFILRVRSTIERARLGKAQARKLVDRNSGTAFVGKMPLKETLISYNFRTLS